LFLNHYFSLSLSLSLSPFQFLALRSFFVCISHLLRSCFTPLEFPFIIVFRTLRWCTTWVV
jgi:hypothetical protein